MEHIAHVLHSFGVEARDVECSQAFAVIEHKAHFGYLLGVEARYVKFGQEFAVIEHIVHKGHILSFECRYVELLQGFAAGEHPSHVGYFVGIEVLYIVDGGKLFEAVKPHSRGGRVAVRHRIVKCHGGNYLSVIHQTPFGVAGVGVGEIVNGTLGVCGLVGVVIESHGFVCDVHHCVAFCALCLCHGGQRDACK